MEGKGKVRLRSGLFLGVPASEWEHSDL
jgi:hypothetical protein